MGLDITAYGNLKHIGKHEKDPELNEGEPGGLDDYCYYDDHVDAFAYDSFPDSFRGIPVLGTKGYGNNAFLVGGCFEITPETETHGFRAGSYSGYGQWRQNLASQFNPAPLYLDRSGPGMAKPDPELPFYELIWFADNEGCIGELAAIELLVDFRAHAVAYVDPYDGYGRQKYDDWTRAFELAAASGLVRFH
jgi:hypothetical protein